MNEAPAAAAKGHVPGGQPPTVLQSVGYGHLSPDLDVAVIGGGPGGLAAANAILAARPGLLVAVFERSVLGPRCACLIVMPNGVAALGAINPKLRTAVLDVDCNLQSFGCFSKEGSFLNCMDGKDSPTSYIKEHGGDISTCTWHELQAALAAQLPPGILRQGAAFNRFVEGPGGVTLHFQGGRLPVTARVVVGADGSQSATRAQLLDDGPPLFMGAAVWRAVVPRPEWWPIGQRRVYGLGGNGSSASTGRFNALCTRNGSVSFQAFGPWPAERLDEIGGSKAAYVQDPLARQELGEARRRRALEVFGGWCPEVRSLINAADPLALTEHGQLYRPPEACKVWGRGCLTLLGDAAHLFMPFLGQGTSQAFEDALALGRAIGEHGPTPEALRAYQAFRQPQVMVAHRTSVDMVPAFAAGRPVAPEHEEGHRLGLWKGQFAPLRPAAGQAPS